MNEVKSYFYRQQYFLSTWAHECCNISVIFDVQAFFFSSLIHFEHIISGGKYIHKSFFLCVVKFNSYSYEVHLIYASTISK